MRYRRIFARGRPVSQPVNELCKLNAWQQRAHTVHALWKCSREISDYSRITRQFIKRARWTRDACSSPFCYSRFDVYENFPRRCISRACIAVYVCVCVCNTDCPDWQKTIPTTSIYFYYSKTTIRTSVSIFYDIENSRAKLYRKKWKMFWLDQCRWNK